MQQIYKTNENNKFIKGLGFPAFIHNGDYYVELIKVYEDGIIDCWGECSFEEFEEKVKNGQIVTQLPKEGRVDMFQLFQADASQFDTYTEEEDFIKEVKDALLFLQNKPTTKELCQQAFKNYLNNPNQENKEEVEKTFYAVPKHLRLAILGDMGMGDKPIQSIINGKCSDKKSIDSLKEYFSI
jgi:hypothetical protein